MSQTPITFRPADEAQLERFKLLTLFCGGKSTALRLAVDALYERHAKEIEIIKPHSEAAQAALDAARQSIKKSLQDAIQALDA